MMGITRTESTQDRNENDMKKDERRKGKRKLKKCHGSVEKKKDKRMEYKRKKGRENMIKHIRLENIKN